MIFPDRYKTNKKYPKKLFLENKDIEAKDRSFIKKHVISVDLSHQIMGEDVPSVDNEDYKYKVIQYLEVEVDDIENAKNIGEIFQGIFKSPLIIRFYDEKGYYTYSLALKRISKVNSNEIVITDILNTKKLDSIINIDVKSLYDKYINFDSLLNTLNKVYLYYEIYIKAFIIDNRKEINSYKDLLDSKIYYDFNNMVDTYTALNSLIKCENNIKKASTMSKKIEINNKKKECLEIIKNINSKGGY